MNAPFVNSKHRRVPSYLTAALALGVWACSSGPNPADDDGQGNGYGDVGAPSGAGGSTASSGQGTYSCCVNGAFYACPGEAELTQCGGFDIDACMQGCGFDDFTCQDACFEQWASSEPDPSACTRTPAADAQCNGGGAGGAGGAPSPAPTTTSGGSSCLDILEGCEYNFDCCSGNCTLDACRGTGPGEWCDYNFQCASSSCVDGTCE